MSLLAVAFTALLFFLSAPEAVSAVHMNGLQTDPPACTSPYTVQYGDSLRKIAKRCGVTASELIAANPQIANPDRILVGWQINLPGQPVEDAAAADSNDPTAEAEAGEGSAVDELTVDEPAAVNPPAEWNDTERVISPRPEVSGVVSQPVEEEAPSAGEQANTVDDAQTPIDDSQEEGGGQTAPVDQNAAGSQETDASEETSAGVNQSYQIQWGDSLGKIAKRMGVTISQIMYVNPEIRNPNVILPGQVIAIPPASLVVPEDAWKEQRIDQALAVSPTYSPSANERWIQVDLATQTAHAYEGETLVRSFIVSTGLPRTPTVTGQFKIWTKLRFDDMRGPGYNLKAVPYVMYFYKGYGLHGTYWHNNFGSPMSHGCVNFATEDAAWLFDFASVGTVVNVQ